MQLDITEARRYFAKWPGGMYVFRSGAGWWTLIQREDQFVARPFLPRLRKTLAIIGSLEFIGSEVSGVAI